MKFRFLRELEPGFTSVHPGTAENLLLVVYPSRLLLVDVCVSQFSLQFDGRVFDSLSVTDVQMVTPVGRRGVVTLGTNGECRYYSLKTQFVGDVQVSSFDKTFQTLSDVTLISGTPSSRWVAVIRNSALSLWRPDAEILHELKNHDVSANINSVQHMYMEPLSKEMLSIVLIHGSGILHVDVSVDKSGLFSVTGVQKHDSIAGTQWSDGAPLARSPAFFSESSVALPSAPYAKLAKNVRLLQGGIAEAVDMGRVSPVIYTVVSGMESGPSLLPELNMGSETSASIILWSQQAAPLDSMPLPPSLPAPGLFIRPLPTPRGVIGNPSSTVDARVLFAHPSTGAIGLMSSQPLPTDLAASVGSQSSPLARELIDDLGQPDQSTIPLARSSQIIITLGHLYSAVVFGHPNAQEALSAAPRLLTPELATIVASALDIPAQILVILCDIVCRSQLTSAEKEAWLYSIVNYPSSRSELSAVIDDYPSDTLFSTMLPIVTAFLVETAIAGEYDDSDWSARCRDSFIKAESAAEENQETALDILNSSRCKPSLAAIGCWQSSLLKHASEEDTTLCQCALDAIRSMKESATAAADLIGLVEGVIIKGSVSSILPDYFVETVSF